MKREKFFYMVFHHDDFGDNGWFEIYPTRTEAMRKARWMAEQRPEEYPRGVKYFNASKVDSADSWPHHDEKFDKFVCVLQLAHFYHGA